MAHGKPKDIFSVEKDPCLCGSIRSMMIWIVLVRLISGSIWSMSQQELNMVSFKVNGFMLASKIINLIVENGRLRV